MNKNDLLNQMNGRSVTNGWDVVCAISTEHISALLADKYYRQEQNGALYQIKDEQHFELGSISFDLQLGPPLISFLKDDPTRCVLRLEIKKGQAEVKDLTGKTMDSQQINTEPNEPIKYYITCLIPLYTIEGTVNNTLDVVINFSQTEKVLMEIDSGKTLKQYICIALQNYFKNNLGEEGWSLGQLIYQAVIGGIALTPDSFSFTTSVSKDGTGCLILFITLKGGVPGRGKELIGGNGIIDIPYPDAHSAALIISSRVLFQNIFQNHFQNLSFPTQALQGNTAFSPWVLMGNGVIDCGEYVQGRQHQPISIPTLNFMLYSNTNNALQISWSLDYIFTYPYWKTEQVFFMGPVVSKQVDAHIRINIFVGSSSYKFSIADTTQVVSCSSSQAVYTNIIGGNEKGTPIEIVSIAVKQVYDKLNHVLGQNFNDISIFTLSNLLFPADQVITYDVDGVYVPGDLVIFGNIKHKL